MNSCSARERDRLKKVHGAEYTTSKLEKAKQYRLQQGLLQKLRAEFLGFQDVFDALTKTEDAAYEVAEKLAEDTFLDSIFDVERAHYEACSANALGFEVVAAAKQAADTAFKNAEESYERAEKAKNIHKATYEPSMES